MIFVFDIKSRFQGPVTNVTGLSTTAQQHDFVLRCCHRFFYANGHLAGRDFKNIQTAFNSSSVMALSIR